MSDKAINFENIQGNIFGGFNKDYQTMLFLKFKDLVKGRKWIGHIAGDISSSEEVLAFNQLFKLLKARHGKEGIVNVTWTNLAFSYSGLETINAKGLAEFPLAFRQGMAARAEIIGDIGHSAPANWIHSLGTKDVHAILIVASDLESELCKQVDEYIKDPVFTESITLLHRQEGRARLDVPGEAGHEHFGFKDGVSQPGIRGLTPPNESNPNQGQPGQDLLHPGEFVLGYPTQIPTPKETVNGSAPGPNPIPGSNSESGPFWTTDGSYLVFRRLQQDVPKFNESVEQLALENQLSPALMGAKLVGRYKSGAPLEKTEDMPDVPDTPFKPSDTDPSKTDPSLIQNERINLFEYGGDLKGEIVPRAAHIRKAYPRDQIGGAGSTSESETQTHRLLRRGIQFGKSFDPSHPSGDTGDRGLLFLAYQTDIERQFEFVQRFWVNDPNFPCPSGKDDQDTVCKKGATTADGEDPIIAQSPAGSFNLPSPGCPMHSISVRHFVTTTGGEYFFQPSIKALYQLAVD
jgi:Dyp-type peroxidase family